MFESQTQRTIQLSERAIGAGHPCFIIAEAGVNHNGDLEMARQLIDVAVEAGADAVKFQTFRAEAIVAREAPKAQYQLQTTSTAESQFDMLKRLELSAGAHTEIQSYCHTRRIEFLSTPFDTESIDLLDRLGVPAFKISSGDITNLPLLRHAAGKGKAMLLSTGMSGIEEVQEAVTAVRDAGCDQVILLQCVSNYPAEPADVNLRAMQTMADKFGVPVGYSDHTTGIEIAMAAVALGACVIEKHFTLDRGLPGPDHRASLEPDELRAMVEGIRKVEAALGDGRKIPAASEADTASIARRSLMAAGDISAGTRLTAEMVVIKRPGTGLPPRMLKELIGRPVRVDIASGSMLSLEMFDEQKP
ncbi:MAG TPA: N-acetylneuraminate synthase [Pyrinomonadaceae bacterium]|nr:N-acetylneuraminate synthase [Pyrinomonadaceae bacterium]